MTETAISVQNISKKFKIYHEKRNSIFDQVSSIFNKSKHYEELAVIRDISFELKKGEMLGILGLNGSGKTTLLKMLAGIIKPDSGKITTSGKVIPLLELGTGFSPELTARDNIILNGMILGFTKKEMIEKIDSIIEFADLPKFLDTKLKNFSSGMYSRLAFSIAMQVDPDILLVDEILAVGDAPFRDKSFNAFLSFRKKNKSIIFVSHDLGTIQRLCDRAIFLHEGKIHTVGKSNEVVNAYYRIIENRIPSSDGKMVSITRRCNPVGIAVNSATNKIFVVNMEAGIVSVIDGNSNEIIGNIEVGASPREIVVDEKKNIAYVTNRDSNTVSVIDCNTHELKLGILVGDRPRGIFLNQEDEKIFVSNRDSSDISVIDTRLNKKISTIPVTGNPMGLTHDPLSNIIYVASMNANSLNLVDVTTGKEIQRIPVGESPTAVSFSEKQRRVYVTNKDSDSINVIDVLSRKILKNISEQDGPVGIAVENYQDKLFVCNSGSNKVCVIDSNTHRTIAEIPVGNYPLRIAINSKTGLIYATNQADDSISVIDEKTNAVIHTINLVKILQPLENTTTNT